MIHVLLDGMSFDFRKARLFLELRQTDIADRTGVTVQQIAAVERGEYIHPHFRRALENFLMEQLRDELGRDPQEFVIAKSGEGNRD